MVARLTRLRGNVLMVVLSVERPLTADEILDVLGPKDPSATRAVVYRSLDFLTALGWVHRIESAKSFIAGAIPDRLHPSQLLVCRRRSLQPDMPPPTRLCSLAIGRAYGLTDGPGGLSARR